jgi:hypothetical protein
VKASKGASTARPRSTTPARTSGAKRPATSSKKRITRAGGRTGSRTQTSTTKQKGKRPDPAPVVQVAVRELDPQRKCGAGTSVQLLYRVDENVDGRASAHLVFFDRHGWYCEHGRSCPAVAHARKHNGKHPGQIARVS